MDQDSLHIVAASKVPMLKPGEYELWRMRMEQYIQMTDYSLWEVIENGNAPPITKVVEGVETTINPTTTEEKAQKSQLEIHGESILQEDVNQKFLRSLSPEWNTHTIVWRNKPEIDTLSMDDLYNNLKIYEPEVKGTSSLSTNTQNIAFVSSNSTNSTNGAVNTAHGATTASTQATVVKSTTINNLSDAIICAFFAIQGGVLQLPQKGTLCKGLERMGYENLTQKLTFYKAYFSSQWKFLIHTILQCLSAKTTSWNEFSSTMASAIICLATNQKFNLSKYIFDNMVKNLDGGVKFLMYPRFVQVFLDKQVEGMSKHKGVYVTPSHTKKVFANMKRPCKGFSGRVTPLFSTMMVQATEDMGADSATPTDSHSTPIITQPSSSKPQKKKSRRKQRKDSAPTEPTTEETTPEEHVSTPSYDPPPSGEDRMQLAELMSLCTNLQEKVLDLEKAKTAQAKEITSLKKRVKQLEKRRKSRTSGLRRLRKVGSSSRVESSNDASLGAQEDASKQGRKIEDLDADAEVTLVNETQEMNDDNLMFDTGVLEEQEIEFEKVVEEPVVSVATTTKSIPVSAAEVVTTASASVEIPDELTLAQTLIEIKTAKPKPVTTAATTVTSVRPRAKGIIFHDQEEQVPASTKTFSSSQSQLPQVKDKGKGKMVEPEVPLKKKDQVALDEEMARNLEAQLQAELIKEERLVRQKEEEANIDFIKSWDNTQAMMEPDFKLAQRTQAEEHGEITIEERSRLFVELMNRRKKHFAKLRAEEIRRKPPTKAQKRNQMSTYLKNMARYKHSQLKSKSYDEIHKLFDKEIKRVNTFVDMNSEVVKGSETRTEESSKRAGDELESDKSKKQKIDEHVEVEKDDQEEAEMKRHIEIVKDDEVAIDVIPLATKPPGIDREDLVTLWKLVKAKHGNTRPEEDYERVLWGDLKVMFEPDIKSKVWRNLQGYIVTVWKLFDNCGVRFMQKMNIKLRGGLLDLKNFKMILRVTTAQIYQEGINTSPIYLLSKASKTKSWLWHRRLSHLNFSTLNKLAKDGLARGIPKLKFLKDYLCSACALGKSKKSFHQPKAEDTNQEKLYLLHMDLYGPIEDLGKLNAKADIGIFVGYAPARKLLESITGEPRKLWKQFM
ncbi:putative ribonuclease H-like domain-containing protein [Tanacetum coccineum]